jgi:exopolyphosphatase / guanosine-5'-triphosphate,3'-diphosphate pyrophosphatase
MRVAAVDIGTNTVRLLVSDHDRGVTTDVLRDREITRLGAGVDAAHELDPGAIDRTVDAAARFAQAARDGGAEQIRMVGTSALRDARNSDDFRDALLEAANLPLEILSGPDEGRLTLLGATSGLEAKTYVVCDIGGGSTELATPRRSVSLNIGAVRLTERFLLDRPPTHAQIERATEFVDTALDDAVDLGIGGHETLIGVAGTITTVAVLVLGLDDYDRDRVHHSTISSQDVNHWATKLVAATPEEIVTFGPVEPGRADIIGAGALILRRVMKRYGFRELLVSESDILDGIVLDLAERARASRPNG